MKKILSIGVLMLILTFVISFVYAGMGGSKSGGMMGGSKSGGMMGGQKNMEGMLQGHEVRESMMHNMGQMSRLMQQMREMMANKPDAENRSHMSRLMQDISEHILEMSRIMKRDIITQKEMQMLNQHNRKMQEAYEKMRW